MTDDELWALARQVGSQESSHLLASNRAEVLASFKAVYLPRIRH